MKLTKKQKTKLEEIFKRGLTSGLGNGPDGATCIEGAISLVVDQKYNDKPSCVAPEDRHFGMDINDKGWSTPYTRAEALLPLAFKQIGTAGKDRTEWVDHLYTHAMRDILTLLLTKINKQDDMSKLKLKRDTVREDMKTIVSIYNGIDTVGKVKNANYKVARILVNFEDHMDYVLSRHRTKDNKTIDIIQALYLVGRLTSLANNYTSGNPGLLSFSPGIFPPDTFLNVAVSAALRAYDATT